MRRTFRRHYTGDVFAYHSKPPKCESRLDPEFAEPTLVPKLSGQNVDVLVLDLEAPIRVVLDEGHATKIVGDVPRPSAFVGGNGTDEIVLRNPVRSAVITRQAPDERTANLVHTPAAVRH